jgi:hypothetical protein
MPARHRVPSRAGHVRREVGATVGAVAVSIAWGMAISVGAYAVMRASQSLLSPDPNPTEVVWGIHAGYVWRVWTVTYAGGIAAFVVFLMARRRLEDWARALAYAMTIASVLLALQTALFP